ncbi:MAG: ABC transporter ATP-binding protein, partial [Nanoarchaeota archaeon]
STEYTGNVRATGSTTETLRNVELVKSLGLEKQEINRLNNVNEKILNLELDKIKKIQKLGFIQGTLINAMRAVLTFIMMYLIFKGVISIGEFFSLFIYSFFIFTPLSSFGTVASQYQESRASNEQLDEILKINPEKKPENPKIIKNIENIEYKDLSFIYETAEVPSVNNINLTVKRGETIAFVGPSGSGKSTLVKLLVGLYSPKKGKLLLNNVDSKELDYEEIRKKIGFVSQETQLFAGTIRENLLFVNPKANDKDCVKVLKQSAVDHILERGGGLNTKIGEGGIKLSGGEKQILAIARALLRNPELLIFDEATSSLDSITERGVTGTIKEIVKIKKIITVLVAHRLSTIAHADKIYVLENGKIVELGTHEQLIRKKGLYYSMWREQSGEGKSIGF